MSYRTPNKETFIAEDMSTEPTYTAHAYHDPEKIGTNPAVLEGDLVEADRYGATKRGLKSRHIQLIALGGAIGRRLQA